MRARLHAIPASGLHRPSEESPQGRNVTAIITGFINRSLKNKSLPRQQWAVENSSEGVQPDFSLSDIFMAVHARTARRFGIVGMDHVDAGKADGPVNRLQRFFQPF